MKCDKFCNKGHDISIVGRYVNGQCKECKRIYRLEHKNKATEYWKQYRIDNRSELLLKKRENNKKLKNRFSHLRAEARNRYLSCNLSFDQYVSIISNFCHYCKVSLSNRAASSLDRIDNLRGYEIDNVLPCCGDCNSLRGDRLTVTETEVVVKALLEYRKSLI